MLKALNKINGFFIIPTINVDGTVRLTGLDSIFYSDLLLIGNLASMLFLILLTFSCFYLCKKLDIWLSPYNLIIYSKKQLLLSFLFFYAIILLALFIFSKILFFIILENNSISFQFFLFIFFINIITLSFTILIKYKIFKQNFSFKFYKSSFEYYKQDFIKLQNKINTLTNTLNKNNTQENKEKIQIEINKLKEIEIKYNNLQNNDPFTILIKKSSLLQNMRISWLKFYNFILNFFSVFYLFIFFIYFKLSFTFYSSINIAPYYIFSFLFLILLYRFFQNYLYLLTIKKNNKNFIFTEFETNKSNALFFGIPDSHILSQFGIAALTVSSSFIYILLNCKILLLIFNKIYLKNNPSFMEILFKIPFKPELNNLVLPTNLNINSFITNYMGFTFLLIIILLSLMLINFYFHILSYIYIEKLAPIFLQESYNFNTPFLPKEFDENRIKNNLENFKIGKLKEIGISHAYEIIWFKYLPTFIQINKKIHSSFTKFKYSIYFFLGSYSLIIIFIIITLLINYYYNLYTDLYNDIKITNNITTIEGTLILFLKRMKKAIRGAVQTYRNTTDSETAKINTASTNNTPIKVKYKKQIPTKNEGLQKEEIHEDTIEVPNEYEVKNFEVVPPQKSTETTTTHEQIKDAFGAITEKTTTKTKEKFIPMSIKNINVERKFNSGSPIEWAKLGLEAFKVVNQDNNKKEDE